MANSATIIGSGSLANVATVVASTECRSFFKTSIGRKYIMALSGLIWSGFVFGHMAGNMLILVSKDLYNAYGHAIVSNAPLLYATEGALIFAILAHVVNGIILTIENRRARGGTKYAAKARGKKATSFAAQTMAIHGTIILIFVISHLIQFKFGTYYETTVKGVVMRDLHRLITELFEQPAYVAWYVISVALLGIHLSHGFGSTVQSLGLKTKRIERWIKPISYTYAIVVATGFLSQPIYVYLMNN